MRTRIALGAGLLLTLGTAVAGTLMYGRGATEAAGLYSTRDAAPPAEEVTAETIALWKATAASMDYIAPKVPI